MSTLVECVPNFSEGRDKTRVDAIVDAMKMPGVYLLDRESDFDQDDGDWDAHSDQPPSHAS